MDKDKTLKTVSDNWDSWFVPGLSDFVRVPNLTTMVDDQYLTNGKVEEAMKLVDDYINKLGIKGLSKKEFKAETGIPMVVYVVEPTEGQTKNIMVYGHLDKQPYGDGWREDLSPTEPKIEGDLLYGRGSSDDGYAPFSCMLAIKAAQDQGRPMPRVALVLETEEESGSPNLIALLKIASDFIGAPDACLCMDSGAFDYEQLWMTSSLRGICILDVTVEIGAAGYHSGEVGGIVPETFRVVRTLLDRIDDSATGDVKLPELICEVPQWKEEEHERMKNLAGNTMYEKYPIVEGTKWCSMDDLKTLYKRATWDANLSITGIGNMPEIAKAGNVIRPKTSVRLSCRLPPTCNPPAAQAALEKALTTDVPYNAKVTIAGGHTGSGWCMKDLDPAFLAAIKQAGSDFYGKDAGGYAIGGSIPFLSELEKMYPTTQIVALGVLGPAANAHGPNEMINLAYAKKLTCSLAHIIAHFAA